MYPCTELVHALKNVNNLDVDIPFFILCGRVLAITIGGT